MARPDLTPEDIAAILESWGYEKHEDPSSGTFWSHPDHDLRRPTQVRIPNGRTTSAHSVAGRIGNPVEADHVLELLVEATMREHAPAGISFSFIHGWRNDPRKGER